MKRIIRSIEPPTKDQFAKLALAAIRRVDDGANYTYDKAKFRLNDSSGSVLYLDKLYAEYCKLPRSRRDSFLQKLGRTQFDIQQDVPATFDEARDCLRPKIWARSALEWHHYSSLLANAKDVEWPFDPIGEHLISTVVYDHPTSIRTLYSDDFAMWNVSFREAMEVACENLRDATVAYEQLEDGVYSSASSDFYDSSRLLLLDLIEDWEVQGDVIATVPNRDTLLITGSLNEEGLKTLTDMTDGGFRDGARWLSPLPLRLVDGQWEDWMVPSSHELYPQFKELESLSVAKAYGQQQDVLDELHEKEGIEIFLADVFLVNRKSTGRQSTYCVWTKGVESLFPKTDLIVFSTLGDTFVICEWERVMEVVGDLVELHDEYYPPLYRVSKFPTAKRLKMIGQVEI